MTSDHVPDELAARYNQLLFEVGEAREALKKAAAATSEAYAQWTRLRRAEPLTAFEREAAYELLLRIGDQETFWRSELQRRKWMLKDILGEWAPECEDDECGCMEAGNE